MVTDKYYLAEGEHSLVFTVNTCSLIHVLLRKLDMQPYYQLDINSDSISIKTLPTGATYTMSIALPQPCSDDRQFWVSKSDGVISAGYGFPGEKEVVRLVVGPNAEHIALAWMSTEPAVEEASFEFFRSKMSFHFAVDQNVP